MLRSLNLDFRSAYRHVQQERFGRCGVLGPVNIYNPTNWRLLLLFLGTFGCSVDWASVDVHWRSSCSAVLIWQRAKVWLTGRRLLLAQQKLDEVFTARRLPTTRGFTIVVPKRCLVPAVKAALQVGVASQPAWDCLLRNYVLESSRVVLGKEFTFADSQNCARKARKFDWSQVRHCSDEDLAAAICGIGARRVEANWKVPVQTTEAEDVAAVKKCLWGWCSAFLLPQSGKICRRRAAQSLQRHQAWLTHRKNLEFCKPDYNIVSSQFSHSKTEVVCPDDKVKQYKWIVLEVVYFLMAAYFVCVSSTWQAVNMSVAEAQAWFNALLTVFVPTRLKRAFGVLPGREFLPYCYNSIKAKCFLNGRRVCSRPGHSCMRRIVSYAQWPARKVWRQAGKALAFLLQETLITDEVWSLKNARRDIESKIDRLLPPRQAGVCDGCHNACCGLQGVTAASFLNVFQLRKHALPLTKSCG